jgi:GNAT superfamily N-acetyltransferase
MKERIDVDKLGFEYISSARDLNSFKCSETEESQQIEYFLKEDALFYHKGKLASVVLVIWNEIVVGYYALAMGNIALSQRKRKKAFGRDIGQSNIPAFLLARMGVHEDHRNKGIGRIILNQVLHTAGELTDKIGFRYILVDSKQQSIGFYRKFGFEIIREEESKGEKRAVMVLDMNKKDSC